MAASSKPEKKKGGGLIGTLAPVLGLTLAAAGGGIALGRQFAKEPAAAHAAAAPAGAKDGPGTVIRELAPIVTNLAGEGNTWMRLQTAVVYDKADAATMDPIVAKVADDTLAFVRTLTVAELQGASGLQHLREDLNERASLRSDGKIKDMVIEAMVIQ